MQSAPIFAVRSPSTVKIIKDALSVTLPKFKSTHLTEALAAAFGFKSHAALLSAFSPLVVDRDDLIAIDESRFSKRLAELSGRTVDLSSGPTLFHTLGYDSRSDIIRTWSPDHDKVRFDSQRRRAWRNVMVAGINACLENKLFGVRAGDDRWPGATDHHTTSEPYIFRTKIADIDACIRMRNLAEGELRVSIALWPSDDVEQSLGVHGDEKRVGDVCASGHLERQEATYLQATHKDLTVHCTKERLPAVLALDVAPYCYADRGTSI